MDHKCRQINCPSQDGRHSIIQSQFITRLNFNVLQHSWIIANFSQHKGDTIPGSIFSDKQSGTTWRVFLIPVAMDAYYRDQTYFGIKLVESKSERIKTKIRFPQITVKYGQEIQAWEPEKKLNTFMLCPRDKLIETGLLKDDTFTLIFEICILSEVTDFIEDTNAPACDLGDKILSQFGEEKFSDVTLCANRTEFKAHKVILSAQSLVFNAMFSHDLKESQNNRVDLKDIEPEILKEMLVFIYSGKTKLEEVGEEQDKVQRQLLAVELLKASDKYQLDRLKYICEKILSDEMLNVESSAEMLALSEALSAQLLKNRTLMLINCSAKDVVKTEGWKKISAENPSVLLIALAALRI